jgi:LEA14-like dessication related protein
MNRMRWMRAAGVMLLGSCTPLGLWLYEDPVVTVARVTLEPRATLSSPRPVVVALDVHNRNDYPLSTTQMQVSLSLDGVPIGRSSQDSTLPVPMEAVSTVALALALEKRATPSQLRSLGSGRHRFSVSGLATFQTPIGARQVRFAEEGDMIFGRRQDQSTP